MAALCGLCGGIGHKQLCWGRHAVVPHDQGACIGQQCGLRAPHEAPLAAQVHPVHLQDLGSGKLEGCGCEACWLDIVTHSVWWAELWSCLRTRALPQLQRLVADDEQTAVAWLWLLTIISERAGPIMTLPGLLRT